MTRTQTWSLDYYDPRRVKESLSASCHLEIRNNSPVLSSRFGDAMELREWGIAIGGSMVNDKPDSFTIISARGRLRHTWTWSQKKDKPDIISVEYLDPAHTDEKAGMTIRFGEDTSASTWFMWLRKYATQTATGFSRRPQTCPVVITRTVYSWWQKAPHSIQRRRSIDSQWKNLMSGYSQNSRIHEEYFTYVRNDMIGFVSVRSRNYPEISFQNRSRGRSLV
ncbi:hypothetical protein JB92DRAFT_1295070 [Gautieria morchelliformis]|nr:hypothetical protein JB92DRAFT_1295070 [Gautieria morchelliformis]